MNDTFDSRALRSVDCYGQRFMKAGTYCYNVLPIGGHCLTEERPFTIEVSAQRTRSEMQQRNVIVRSGRTGRAEFNVEPAMLSIEEGDMVLWNCASPGAAAFIVVGDKEFFASHRLVNESGFTHAFGVAGDYHWRDAYGSALGGVVRVRNPECKSAAEISRWQKSLAQAALVMISDQKAEPGEVEIVTGQTVFFAVTKSPGISITDARLLPPTREAHGAIPRSARTTK